MTLDIERYQRNGFLLVDVLDDVWVHELRLKIRGLFGSESEIQNRMPKETLFHSSNNQHFGDELKDYGKKTKHYYFHLLTNPDTISIHSVFHNSIILEYVEQILGPSLIFNNASLFAAEPGTHYSLSWHRDVIQIPEEEILEEEIYNPSRFHNNVQVNLPLYDDNTLWVVPGSHSRPNSKQEKIAFRGSKHYAPLGADMPGGVNVEIRPGQAVLYNNNLIHRGHCERFENPRLSLHLGYHSALKPPTWHFYLLDASQFTEKYVQQLSPTVRRMVKEYFECREKYPQMEDTWPKRLPTVPE